MPDTVRIYLGFDAVVPVDIARLNRIADAIRAEFPNAEPGLDVDARRHPEPFPQPYYGNGEPIDFTVTTISKSERDALASAYRVAADSLSDPA